MTSCVVVIDGYNDCCEAEGATCSNGLVALAQRQTLLRHVTESSTINQTRKKGAVKIGNKQVCTAGMHTSEYSYPE